MTEQFGRAEEGLTYIPRIAAYGILPREGEVACVRIGYDSFTYDLPGGAIDPGETPEQAIVREFGEETGLMVEAVRFVGEIRHYIINADGTPYNNHARFYEVRQVGEKPELKCEDDHMLVWLKPLQVITSLKNEGYAWPFVQWLRRHYR